MTGGSVGGWGIAVFPLAAAVISAVFGTVLLRRFAGRRRLYELTWSVALFMYAAASVAAFLGVANGWSAAEYRVYWLLGAVLNVVFLAQGELHLLSRSRLAGNLVMAVVVVITVVSTAVLATADIDGHALARALPLGREALGEGSMAYQLRWLSWLGYFVLLGGTVWSTSRMRGRPDMRDRTVGTLWIALGATVVAIGSGIGAGFAIVPLFSVSLAAGIAVMFLGFLRAGGSAARRRREARLTG